MSGNISYNFDGMTVVVTGAARGVGLAIAERFARSGAATFAIDMDEGALGAASAVGATPIVADVANADAARRVIDTALAATGRVDVMINNAGILRDRFVWKLTEEDWQAVLNVHLTGTFNFTQACVPAFRQQGFGRLINVTSYTGLHGNLGQANYAAAKGGIISFTKTVAKELAGFGVTANCISPNAETRMIESIPADRRKEAEQQIPLGRFAAPSEMADAVAFLASKEASYITGVVLPVDGGISM